MSNEEKIAIIKGMIREYDRNIKNINYGDYYISECKRKKEAMQGLLDLYEKEKEKNNKLESDIQQKNFEIKCLNSDIKNMYCEEGVIAILEDNFDLSREEAIQILKEE